MRTILLFFTSLASALYAVEPTFSTGQAARLLIGQKTFTAQEEGASDTLLGAVSGLAWANNQLFVVDANRVGATPINNRVLIYNNVPSGLPGLTAEFPVNDERCPICVGKADVVLGQPDFTTVPPGPDPTTGVIPVPPPASRTNLRVPVGVATDGRVLVVSDTDYNRVLIWNSIPATNATPPDIVLGQPDFTRTVPNDGGGATPNNRSFKGPQGVWIQNGKLFVADAGNNRVLIWNSIPTSNFQQANVVVGAPDFNTAVQPDLTKETLEPKANTMLTPVGVSSDGQRMYVADLGHNRILIWNAIPTQNNQPADIVIGQPDMTSALSNISTSRDENGALVFDQAYAKRMCDPTDRKDDDGNPVYPNICGRTLNFPRYVLSDGNYLFVADAGNDRILVYNQIPTQNGANADAVIGQIRDTINLVSDSADPGGVASSSVLRTPQALAFDGTNLYASDPFNRRVLVFTLSERRVPNTGVRNAASREVFASETISFSGNITKDNTVSIKINGREYKYTVKEDDGFLTLVQGIADLINAGEGDPDVTAYINPQVFSLTLTARRGGPEGNDISYTVEFSSGATLQASSTGSFLRGGNDAAKIAPGTIVTILGEELAENTVSADPSAQVLPRELGGVQVYFDGIRAPVLMVSPTEVRAQLPIEVNDAQSTNAFVRTVRSDGRVSVTTAISVPVVGFNPGIFAQEGVADPRPGIVTHSSSRATALLTIDGIVNGGDRANVTINGRTYTYIVQEGDTLTTIRDALILLIGQDPEVEAEAAGAFTRIRLLARVDGPAGNGIPVSSSVSDSASLVLGFTNVALCCANIEGALVTEANPALPGEQIAITATGLGLVESETGREAQKTGIAYDGPPATDPQEFVSSLVGGRTANVVSASLKQGTVGLYEVILELNSDQPTNALTQATIAQGIYVSNVVTFPVYNPAPPPAPTPTANLTGALNTPGGPIDLTSVGTADWIHFGLTDATTVTRKAAGGSQISAFTPVGNGNTSRVSNTPIGFTWTDGSPAASATNSTTGVSRSGEGSGFTITVPADTKERTLILYVGTSGTNASLVAHLSDSSSPDFTNVSANNSSTVVGRYTLKYKAANADQNLSVTFTQASNLTNGSVFLMGAALQE